MAGFDEFFKYFKGQREGKQPENEDAGYDLENEVADLISALGFGEGQGEEGSSPCNRPDCPLHITANGLQEFLGFCVETLGPDFVVGVCTPDHNPIVRYIRHVCAEPLDISRMRMMTMEEGVLLLLDHSFGAGALYHHELPEWVVAFIKAMRATLSQGEDVTAAKALEIVSKL